MKEYKENLPQITLQLRKGETFKCQITQSSDAMEVFRKIWDNDSLPIYESMIALYLNRNNNTVGWLKVSQGGMSGTVVDIRLIMAAAINSMSSSIIICHNHPSGNTEPSQPDINVAKKLKDAANVFDIKLLDSLT